MRFRDRILRFMYGRYGVDALYRFLTVLLFALIFVNMFIRSIALSIITWGLLIFTIYRVFSRNIYRRSPENAKYLKVENSVVNFFKLQKGKLRDRNTHVYRKCPSCRAVLRFPKRKGEHTAVCPKCGKTFGVKV